VSVSLCHFSVPSTEIDLVLMQVAEAHHPPGRRLAAHRRYGSRRGARVCVCVCVCVCVLMYVCGCGSSSQHACERESVVVSLCRPAPPPVPAAQALLLSSVS
jgi:hypothetical protein